MSKKEVRKDEKKDVYKYIESLGFKIDDSSVRDSTKRLAIASKETAVIDVARVVYDAPGYKGEIKSVRIEGRLNAYSGFISLGEDFSFEIGDKVHWDSSAPEAEKFFGTISNQKPLPQKLVIIHRQDKYSWFIANLD